MAFNTAMVFHFLLLLCYKFRYAATKMSNISEFVKYYEPVWITSIMYPQAIRGTQPIQVEFYAFNRTFTLSANMGECNVVAPDAQVEFRLSEKDPVIRVAARSFLSRMMEGTLLEYPLSKVHGMFYNGVLDVVIWTIDTVYYVEPTDNYFEDNMPFKSVMYRSSDVDVDRLMYPGRKKTCKSYQKSYVLGPFENETRPVQRNDKTRIRASRAEPGYTPSSRSRSDHKEVCLLKLVADHCFFQTVGRHNFRTTTEEMVKLVRAASAIFGNTSFPVGENNMSEIITLQVKIIYIHKSQFEPNYRFYDEKLSAEAFLERLAKYNFDGYCLGVGFTFRNFKRRVLGLAYLADPESNGTLGGICQMRKYIPLRFGAMSYNTAFVSVGSNGRALPKTISVLSLTHELGHSFGAHHDPESNEHCNPTEKGAYLMTSHAVDGKFANNRRFSPCSKEQIGLVYEKKSEQCFQHKAPVCGNGIAEDFEECDCGHAYQCAETDACCTPVGGIGNDAECTYRRQEGKTCSPVKDPCCTSACQVVSADTRKICTEIGACHEESYCDGESAQCPPSSTKKDWELCDQRTGICLEGVCEKHVCSAKEAISGCECEEPEFRCLKCCRENVTKCRPAHEFGLLAITGLSIVRPHGEPCESGTNKVCNSIGDCVDPFISESMPDADAQEVKVIQSSSHWDTLLIIMVILLVILILIVCVGLIYWLRPTSFSWLKRR